MTERSSEEIRRDIERTRERMDEKADALEQKLTPGEIVDDLWNRIRRGDAASGIGDLFRDHPMPIALMALGLGWMAIERSTGSRGERLRRRYGDIEPGTWEAAEGRRGPYLPDDVSLRGAEREGGGIGEKMGELKEKAAGAMHRASDAMQAGRERAGSAMEGMRERTGDTMEEMRERAGGMREAASRTGESARDIASGVAHRARDAMDEGRYRAHQARRGMSQMLDEHPLALAAMAFGAGLAAGVSVPTTRVEDRLMGDAADAVKEEIKDAGRRTAEQVKSVAQDTAQAAKDEVSRQGEKANLADRAQRVVDRAADTAQRRSREEGLLAEGRGEDRPPPNEGTGQPG